MQNNPQWPSTTIFEDILKKVEQKQTNALDDVDLEQFRRELVALEALTKLSKEQGTKPGVFQNTTHGFEEILNDHVMHNDHVSHNVITKDTFGVDLETSYGVDLEKSYDVQSHKYGNVEVGHNFSMERSEQVRVDGIFTS